MIGQILSDRYEVKQLLGKKAGRWTLLACDLKTEELVVIKLLSFASDFEWNSLKLFEREAQTLKSLSHPFIPQYLDYFEVKLPTLKGFALVQSYIPAQTLEQYLQTGRTFYLRSAGIQVSSLGHLAYSRHLFLRTSSLPCSHFLFGVLGLV